MHPQLLTFPRIPSYGTMLLLAWGIGWWLARRRARRFGIAAWQVDWLMPLLIVGTGLGSRIAGQVCRVLFHGGTNDRILYGGFFAAIVVGIGYGVLVRIPLARLADAFAFSLPLGIALLRVGCFLAGCCWGDICDRPERLAAVEDQIWLRQVQTIPWACGPDWPLGVRFPKGSPAYLQHRTAGLLPPTADRSLRVHPVQLYEAAAMLCLLAFLRWIDRRLRRWGESFLLFTLGYAAIRFVTEWFRADNELLVWNLTLSQLASIACACACLAILCSARSGGRGGEQTLFFGSRSRIRRKGTLIDASSR